MCTCIPDQSNNYVHNENHPNSSIWNCPSIWWSWESIWWSVLNARMPLPAALTIIQWSVKTVISGKQQLQLYHYHNLLNPRDIYTFYKSWARPSIKYMVMFCILHGAVLSHLHCLDAFQALNFHHYATKRNAAIMDQVCNPLASEGWGI